MATRTIKVLVYDGDEEPKVEVTVPLRLARWAIKVLPAVKGEIEKHADVDVEALRGQLNEAFDELEAMDPIDLVRVRDKNIRVRVGLE